MRRDQFYGRDRDAVAGHIGDSLETLQRVYAHC
jgi:hypothetical protein